MSIKTIINLVMSFVLATAGLLLTAGAAFAHCDGLDGPVVVAAQKALESGNLNLVLIWVAEGDEEEIKSAFEKTLDVRGLNPQAKELADTYFFETLVRIHRAGEGESYTGLKPAGRDLGPAIPAADKAIETESIDAVRKLLTDKMNQGLHERFHRLINKSGYSMDNIKEGREFVQAYVDFIHYVERLYEAAENSAALHAHEDSATAVHGDQHNDE